MGHLHRGGHELGVDSGLCGLLSVSTPEMDEKRPVHQSFS